MMIKIKSGNSIADAVFVLAEKKTNLNKFGFNKTEVEYIKKKSESGDDLITINRLSSLAFVLLIDEYFEKQEETQLEWLRIQGSKLAQTINHHKYKSIALQSAVGNEDWLLAVAEGCALANYSFNKYKSKAEKLSLNQILIDAKVERNAIQELNNLVEAVFTARNLVNEPQNTLNAVTFAEEMKSMGKAAGFKVEVLNKKQIQTLKMGGLLAVNMGSQTPPTFTIMEWKPAKPINKKPIVLVGKGVVYDTGGLSLKPTANSMDYMKCDMAGGAVVAASMYAIAKSKLNVHVIGLVPATDNRPGENAYTPGDVITMYNGKTVEVLNCDAEGRMILADALAYAEKYNPELVLDFATLTGAAAAAIGGYGTVFMGTADEATKLNLKLSGNQVHERLVEFPFWDDYAKLIKSDIADMKNIGGAVAGAITAGKFLEKFTNYPWMHFDIAGPSWNTAADAYRPKNGTGIGVRLVVQFIKNLTK
ncbi:MAG: leucyl aminopeptidase [Bacteroidia bacterium]|jgi:leucyl aminopeptidase|nr:leucyl aminopeptidase [Bacteroidia bacterium]